MTDFLINVGDSLAISIFLNEESECAIILDRIDDSQVGVKLYCESDAAAEWSIKALEQGIVALQATLHKNRVSHLIEKRITEIEEMIAEEENDFPSPTDDLGDIPF